MTLEQLNALFMIRKYEGGGDHAVFRRPVEEKEQGIFRSVVEEDVARLFPNVTLEAAPAAPVGDGGDGNGVEEPLNPGGAGTALGPNDEWKAAARKRVLTFGRSDRLLAYAAETLQLTIQGDAAGLPVAELKDKILEAIERM